MPRKRRFAYNPMFVYATDYIQTTLEEAIQQNRSTLAAAIQRQAELLAEWEARHRAIPGDYATKTTISGRMLESEVYISFHNRRDFIRATNRQRSAEDRKRQNDKNAQRKFVRKFHANFVEGDISFTGGFSPAMQPQSLKECVQHFKRFMDRLKYHSQKAGAEKIK